MKQTKTHFRHWRMLPLKYKLSIYFIGFSALMLVFLWVFQTAFLEPCYTIIKQNQVRSYAQKISAAIKTGDGASEVISSLSRQNEMSVYVYNTTDSIFTKLYSSEYNNPSGAHIHNMHDVYAYYRLASQQGGIYTSTLKTELTEFEKNYVNGTATDDEASFRREMFDRRSKTENMLWAEIIKVNDKECFTIVTALITPVRSVLSTLHMQLIIVSVLFTLFAVVLAFVVSRRISRPLVEINAGVKELARQNYDREFNSTGYLEAKELSDTLNVTRRELRRADNLKRELIANISHDLRTPLTMITGYGEVMRDLPGENTPENVQVIIDEANRLTSLVNDMLDLSKLQAGTIELDREEFCLTDEINDIFLRYAKLREQEGYNITLKSDKRAFVYADRIKIGQVIYNFVNNAINHCGDDKAVIVTQKTTDKRVRVEVTDHGEGIDSDKLKDIWDRYYKVDKSHRRGVIGTGLGLSIVKNILDLHGARYGVNSKPGAGSTFWFELDCARHESLRKGRSKTEK